MKCTKVGTSNLKKDTKTGRGHKTSHNIQIQRTCVYTVQAITGHMIVQQDINTRPTCHQSCWQYRYTFFSLFSSIFKSFTHTTFSAESVYSWIINTHIDGQQPPVVPAGTPETSDSTSTTTGKPTGKTFSAS